MHKELDGACSALEALAIAVTNGWGSDVTLCEGIGWFGPAITRHELADLARALAGDLRSTNAENIPPTIATLVQDIPRRLQLLQTNTLPQMFNGNGGQAVPAYISTLATLRSTLLPPLGWQALPDRNSLPASLARRSRAAEAELDQLAPQLAGLSKKIEDIQAAHAIAEDLPIDMQALAVARTRLGKSADEAEDLQKKIRDARLTSISFLDRMIEIEGDAKKLVAQCQEAYRITTSIGLAGAFDQRATKLALSMWAWVVGLISSLSLCYFVGSKRLEVLSATLQTPDPNWGSVATQAVLSLLSVGAPLWFAWLATKQVGQRFRLTEDYAFKASVAKAYEGYRKEAVRIDPAFEAQLFSSALKRLDEPPLRLVEPGAHGSPWHELANSAAVQRAFEVAPDLHDKVTALLREGINATTKLLGKGANQSKAEEPKAP